MTEIVVLEPVRDDAGDPWDVQLQYGEADREPVLIFRRDLPAPRSRGLADILRPGGTRTQSFRVDYCVSTLLATASQGGAFEFGYGEVMHRLSPPAVTRLAQVALAAIPGTVGRFDVRWIPDEDRVPF